MKRNHLLASLLFALAASACADSPNSPDASRIGEQIRTKGARSTVVALDQKGQFETVLKHIASGDAAWVALAPPLAKGTDASDSTGLTIALARALPKNPSSVLAVLDDGSVLGASAVCGVPFIEPEANEVKTYLEKAIPAVSGVAQKDASHRSACLASLGRAKQQIEANQ